jgi:hypothetical protein
MVAVLAIACFLGLLRASSRGWWFVLPIAGLILLGCWVDLRYFGRHVRPMGWPMVALVSVPCLGILGLGLSPGFYYMGDVAIVLLLWIMIAAACGTRAFLVLLGLGLRSAPTTQPTGRGYETPFLLIPLITTVLIVLEVPLRLGFLTARPRLEPIARGARAAGMLRLRGDVRCGPYTISMTASARRNCHVPGRVYFILADDQESGFVYSPGGIEDLCYNSGTKGHVIGDWYWMAED